MAPEVADPNFLSGYLPDEPEARRNKVLESVEEELEKHPESVSLYAKFLPVINRIALSLSPEDSTAVLAQQRPLFSLLNALERTGVLDFPVLEEELHKKFKALEMKEEMLERAGGTIGVNQVLDILGLSTRQGVNKRRQNGKLIAIELGNHGYQYPLCQLDESRGGTVDGLEEVLKQLDPVDSPWMALQFLVRGNPRFNGKPPIELLRKGEVEPVVKAAKAHGEHGSV
jgi:hypothetical protein